MKVNMTPNPLDVVTIHASQGDTEARQWEFELHNNGELIDTSEITEQLFFKAYKGGTEQILPENTSTPTTSPFLGDIRYPQGLLSDQEFTYRQSPTEEDGLAKITDVKGNTLVWNQQLLAPTTNASTTASADGSFRSNRCTFTYDSATHIITITSLENMGTSGFVFGLVNGAPLVVGHKYLQMCDVQAPKTFNFVIGVNENVDAKNSLSANTYHHVSTIKEFRSNSNEFRFNFNNSNTWTGTETVYIKNAMLFDLTQMGIDITDPSDFTSLFPLSYYSYNQGSLLSFMGNGIKTVGKNQFNSEHAISATSVVESNDNGTITIKDVSSATWSNTYIGYSDVITGKEYTFKALLKYGRIGGNLSSTSYPVPDNQPNTNIGNLIFVAVTSAIPSRTFIPNFTGRIYWWYCTDIQNANHQQFTTQPMLSTTDADFEPYSSSTLSLPISTYFPNGMKSAGNVYDELTENKAITRIGSVDLGTLNYTKSGEMFYATVSNMAIRAQAKCSKYEYVGYFGNVSQAQNGTTNGQFGTSAIASYIFIHDSTFNDATAFKSAMSGVYLYYELETESETSFTTASLVTENAEIPLSNEDGTLIGKCTEQLSENPGFIDAKIKLSDGDGTCYSNKIQLHVERSPQ